MPDNEQAKKQKAVFQEIYLKILMIFLEAINKL